MTTTGYLARDTVHIGDVRELAGRLEPASVQTIVTSPPYWGLRSYLPGEHPDKAQELGGEATPEEFVANLVAVFAALRPALKDDGTIWLNLGDSYASPPVGRFNGGSAILAGRDLTGHAGGSVVDKSKLGLPPKSLLLIPHRVALALQAEGWVIRQDNVWAKVNPMPESVTDRTTRAHEYVFHIAKGPTYFYDAEAIKEPYAPDSVARDRRARDTAYAPPGQAVRSEGARCVNGGRNKRSVWTVPSAQFPDAHYATFPPDLIRPCILAGSRPGDLVLDPFLGSGTVAGVAVEEGRRWIGCDLDERARRWTADRLARLPVGRLAGV